MNQDLTLLACSGWMHRQVQVVFGLRPCVHNVLASRKGCHGSRLVDSHCSHRVKLRLDSKVSESQSLLLCKLANWQTPVGEARYDQHMSPGSLLNHVQLGERHGVLASHMFSRLVHGLHIRLVSAFCLWMGLEETCRAGLNQIVIISLVVHWLFLIELALLMHP